MVFRHVLICLSQLPYSIILQLDMFTSSDARVIEYLCKFSYLTVDTTKLLNNNGTLHVPGWLYYFHSLSQIDTSEADLSDEKVLDHTYSGMEDDTFQASMIALHGSTCSTDLDYLHSSTPKVSNHFHYMATIRTKNDSPISLNVTATLTALCHNQLYSM